MPNIQMIGLSPAEYQEKKPIIDKAMQSLELGNDAVTTWIKALVTSCDGQTRLMPFLRVSTTGGEEESDRIVSALKEHNIGMDCEVGAELLDFLDADEMRANSG